MRLAFILLAVSLLLWGCPSSPEHDNPVDPNAPGYRPLPPRNRPPEISNVRFIWDWRNGPETGFWAFEMTAQVADPDGNLLYYSVAAQIDTAYQGTMSYDPWRDAFTLRRTQNDFPNDSIPFSEFERDTVWIVATDDSSAEGRGWTILLRLDTNNPPDTRFPEDGEFVTPPLSVRWAYSGDVDSFRISIYQYGLLPIWDTSGIAGDVDSIQVSRSLVGGADNLYSWFVTAITRQGDRLTSEPGFFYVLDTVTVAQQGTHGPQEYSHGR